MKARSLRVLLVASMVGVGVMATPADAQESGGSGAADRQEVEAVRSHWASKSTPDSGARGAAPEVGANPWLSLTTGDMQTDVDWPYWRDAVESRGDIIAGNPILGFDRRDEIAVTEAEADGERGANDAIADAELIRGLGTGRRQQPQAVISGSLAPLPAAQPVGPFPEDEGSIPLASPVALIDGGVVTTSAAIGDGPFGSAAAASGDSDFYRLDGLSAGDRLIVDIDTDPAAGGTLDSFLLLYDGDGVAIAGADDDGETLDSLLSFTIPADGSYYLSVDDFFSFLLDPFDSSSGIGVGGEGPYTISFGLNASDVDSYSFQLQAGDVVSVSGRDSVTGVSLRDPAGDLVMASQQDASGIYPAATQLTGGGNAVLDHVAAARGRYTLSVEGTPGAYGTTVRVLRPGLEAGPARAEQMVFLDFDGAEVNTAIFGGPGVRQLSPLSSFLAAWGLGPADESALISQIQATVVENLELQGANSGSRVTIRNSRDHRDPFGSANWSRVIIGGTIEESGIATIGIAQSIDPGNFETEETALVLLDVLSSDPAEFDDASLNSYLTGDSDRIAFIGRAIGNVVSHEIGHYLGNWHVDQFNDVTNLMDQGGNFPLLYGVGPDGVGGTADDPDVEFGEDELNPNEGFAGTEDTAARSGYGLSTTRRR